MNLATLIPLALKTSIILIVFSLGLQSSPQDASYLFRRPGQFVRSLLSMGVVMPVFAIMLAAVFDLRPTVKVALVALALSPVPPILPMKQGRAGGKVTYAIGLLVAAALLAIVLVPLMLEIIERVFGMSLHASPVEIARIVLITVLAPLAVGIAIRRIAPGIAERAAKPMSLVATLLLVASVVPVLFTQWPAISSLIGNGTIAAFAAFVIAGLVVGHLLGGPVPDDRTVLAFSTASRHPGVAIAIASRNFPGEKLVVAAVLLYVLVGAVVGIPYMIWSIRRHASSPEGSPVS
jgi:BASS family bile acid:Na+ symporter